MPPIKILVVEDEAFARETIVDYLNIKGYENISIASRGQEALDKISEEKPDFIFLDIQLADKIDGMEVLRQARSLSPLSKCIMMSAYKDEFGPKAEELGAYYFLKKPIRNLDKIIKLIEGRPGGSSTGLN